VVESSPERTLAEAVSAGSDGDAMLRLLTQSNALRGLHQESGHPDPLLPARLAGVTATRELIDLGGGI
jgi:hypothetical protein